MSQMSNLCNLLLKFWCSYIATSLSLKEYRFSFVHDTKINGSKMNDIVE